ncbi:MAG TPA: GAF domain-containing protein, partial [Syntrophales bacterium]|nr:GAF domain-containing protein [Syntrophales bacterium]
AANAGIWGWEVSTGKLTWSDEFYTLFGLDPAAPASFDTWLGVLHPDDRQRAMERIDRSIREGTPLENEYRIILPDGRERWIRAWGSTLYDESGQPLSMSGICIDTTAGKRAEEALRAVEFRMKAVADHLPVGVWFADETGKIVYGNEAGRQIWAGAHYVDPEEFHVYRAWWAETGKPLGPEDWAVVRAVKKGETSLKEVLEIECFDGTRKTILNSAVPLKSGDGSLSGVVVLNEDITERIEVEQALRRSEASYRSYIEVTGQLGWAANADGEVVDDAPGYRQYTGQTFDEMRDWGWSKALHPDDIEITLAVWRKAVEEKQGYETEFRLRRHDGVYRHFLARGTPILNDDGSVREWVGTCIDITERRRQEEELRKLNRTLRALSRSNEALMRAEEESAFLEEVCRIVIQDCGYAMVWIGYAEDDEDKTVRPVAHAGFSEGYLEALNLTWADRERGRGPTGTAIRTGKAVLCTDMLTDPRFEPWREEAVRRGYSSSLALPLLDEGRAFGAVTIYSTQPDPFSGEEIGLLSEMADDLTYGIASLRLRRLSRQTVQALQESEARFRLLSGTAARLLVSEDPQALVNDLCRDVMEHLDCQAFFNFMVDERAGRLRLNACAGIPEEEVRKLEWLDYGVAVCGCVARDNARIIAEDIFHTPDVRTELVRSYGIQAYCCHPLKAQDRLIGTLSFGTKTRPRFTAEEVDLMRIVADQVAVAMQRVQARQELRASEEALRLANEQLEQRVRERTTELVLILEDLGKSRDDLRKLASELVLAEERERKRISVILHDDVAQALAATKMRLDLLGTVPGGEDVRLALTEARELLGQSIRQARALMTDISNPVLYDMGLRAAVEALAEEVTARQGIAVTSS